MKKALTMAAIAVLAVSCAKPTIVKKGDSDYDIIERSEELFVFLDYHWEGGEFDEAVELEKAFAEYGKEQGVFVYAMGRFPTLRDWQLGFVATGIPEDMEFRLREIKSMKLPAGPYARMETKGNVDYLFRYWRKMSRWIEKDGHIAAGPVIEVYPDIFEEGLPKKEVRGELRYPLEGGASHHTEPEASSGDAGAEADGVPDGGVPEA